MIDDNTAIGYRPMRFEDLQAVVLLDETEWFLPAPATPGAASARVATNGAQAGIGSAKDAAARRGEGLPENLRRASYLAALVDVLHFLSTTTFAAVAEIDGRLAGVALAEAFGHPALFPQAGVLKAQARAELEALDGGARLLELGQESLAANAALAAGPRAECQGEWQLFLVAKEYRGRGIGGQLWRRVREYFRQAGVERYFLFTDTTCDWEIYEAHGMQRAAEQLNVPDVAGTTSDKFIYVGTPEEKSA